jgi:hypothetical protein
MAQTVVDLWQTWTRTYHTLAPIDDEVTNNLTGKTFRLTYLGNWKRRDKLPADVTLTGKPYDDDGERREVLTYRIQDYQHKLVGVRVIPARVRTREPMSPEMEARIQEFINGIGKGGDAQGPESRHENGPGDRVWDLDLPGCTLAHSESSNPLRRLPDGGDPVARDADDPAGGTGDPNSGVLPDQSRNYHCTCGKAEPCRDHGSRYEQ